MNAPSEESPSPLAVSQAQEILAADRRRKRRALRAKAARFLPPSFLALSLLWALRAWVAYDTPVWRQAGSAAAVTASLCFVTAPRLKLASRRRKAAAWALAGLLTIGVFLGAGGLRYTYGALGTLELSYSTEPAGLLVGQNATIAGTALLKNTGGSTVRLMPSYDLKAIGPDGTPLPLHLDGCPLYGRTPFGDWVIVEMPAGSQRSQPLSFEVLWGNSMTVPPTVMRDHCFFLVFERPGNYQVKAVLFSASPGEHTTLPVWSGSVESAPAPLVAS